MKQTSLAVLLLGSFLASASALAAPSLECRIIDPSGGAPSSWAKNCNGSIRYGNLVMVEFRIQNNVNPHSYLWSQKTKNFSPDQSNGMLSVSTGSGYGRVVVFDKNGNTHHLESRYTAYSQCPSCQTP